MGEMPLFPLDIVLFPGMKISLHIFEERYKEMLTRCLDENRLFGVILLRSDQPPTRNPRRVKTFRVGCSARITHVEQLAEGKMDVEIEGVERFRLIEQHEVESYRTGIVESLGDTVPVGAETEVTADLGDEVGNLLKEFLTRQLAQMGQRVVEFDLPRNPATLSLITACILPVENETKQTLLEQTSTRERLGTERDILRHSITRLRRADASGLKQPGTADTYEGSVGETEPTVMQFGRIQTDRYRDYFCGN